MFPHGHDGTTASSSALMAPSLFVFAASSRPVGLLSFHRDQRRFFEIILLPKFSQAIRPK
jgi:hypothetical protein